MSPILSALQQRGVPLDRYLEVLQLSARELAEPARRIEWERFTDWLALLAHDLGGSEALALFGSEIGSLPELELAPAAATLSLRAEAAYALHAKWIAALLPAASVTARRRGRRRFEQVVRLDAAERDAPELFWLLLGFLRAAPRALGLPDASVRMAVAERCATYRIRVPRIASLRVWLRRLLSRKAWLSSALVELSFERNQLEERHRTLADANRRLAAQHRELALLVELGREVTRQTHLPELAQSALHLLCEHFSLQGAVLLASAPTAGRLDEIGRFGATEGAPAHSAVLRSAGRAVGRLDLWRAGSAAADDALLQRFIPWLSLAVANALAFGALSERTRRLQEEMAERRRAERQLVQAQKLEAVGALAGGLAHDFNNILTAIRVYTDLVAKRLPPDHPARADLAEISVAGDRVAALTTQLLAFSRRPVVHPELVDLGAVLARMTPMLSRLMREGSRLEVVTEPGPLWVEIDPGQLEQVIVNLVNNARDAQLEPGVARVSVRRTDAVVELCVEDEGIGMDAATQERVFEPFFTTKPPGQGTGLGLTAAYRIVTELGGRIDLESEPGNGTRVRVELPAREAGGARSALPELPQRLSGKETVLVIEDDEQLLRLIRRTLEEQGYTVLEARSAAAALRLCEQRSGAISAAIADLGVADVRGPELGARLCATRPELGAVVYLSGTGVQASESPSGFLRGQRLVRKPIAPEALLRALRGALAERTRR